MLSTMMASTVVYAKVDNVKTPEAKTKEVAKPKVVAAVESNATASMPAVAQDPAELTTVEKMLEEYKKLQLEGNLEKTLDYIYPPVFTIMPKEQLRKSFKQAQEQGKMPKIIFLEQKISSPIKAFDKGIYLVVEYDMNMTMDATPTIPKDDLEEADRINKMLNDPIEYARFRSFMINMLHMSMGASATIESEEDSLEFRIEKPGHYFMIKEDGKDWKMLDIMPETGHQFKDILPKEIIKNEKEFFKFVHKKSPAAHK